jgi:hypothetical protein
MNIFGITTAHIQYLIFAFVITLLLLAVASYLRLFVQKVNYGLLVIFSWAVLINLLFIADFLELSGRTVFAVLALFVLVVIAIGGWKYKTKVFAEYRRVNDFRQLALLLAGWFIGFAVLIVPLAAGVANRTTISGHFVSNDSVIHAIFARGFEFTRTARPLSDYYNANYPRGIHSFFFYSDKLLQADAYETLLPAILFTYSLVFFAAYYLLSKMQAGRSSSRYLIALAPVVPYLVVAASYSMFAAQIAVVPLMIVAATIIIYLRFDRSLWLNLLALAVISLAAFSIYSVLPISVIAAVAGFKVLLSWWERRQGKLVWDVKLSRRTLLTILFTTVVLTLLALPSIMLAKNMISPKSDSEVGGGLLTSVGNLPSGYLDPLHVTGLWASGTEYRGYLINEFSDWGYLLLVVFTIQIVLISRARLDRRFLIMLSAFALPCLVILVVVRNQYIQFKYLTFFIPLFTLAWFIGLDKLLSKLKWYFAVAVLFSVIAVFVVVPLRSYKLYPSLLDYQFAELSSLHEKYADKGRTLFLSQEDWLQYFIDSSDDYVPMTLYIPLAYFDTGLDYIVIDNAYPQEVTAYLETKPDLQQMVSSGKCQTQEFNRYTVIDVNCFGAN